MILLKILIPSYELWWDRGVVEIINGEIWTDPTWKEYIFWDAPEKKDPNGKIPYWKELELYEESLIHINNNSHNTMVSNPYTDHAIAKYYGDILRYAHFDCAGKDFYYERQPRTYVFC